MADPTTFGPFIEGCPTYWHKKGDPLPVVRCAHEGCGQAMDPQVILPLFALAAALAALVTRYPNARGVAWFRCKEHGITFAPVFFPEDAKGGGVA